MTITIHDLEKFGTDLERTNNRRSITISTELVRYLEETLRAYASLRDEVRTTLKTNMQNFSDVYEWKDEMK
jgi:phosphopantothenate synthetase